MTLQRRTPMHPGTLKRWKALGRSTKPVKPRSAKRIAIAEERRAFVARVLSERPTCEGLFHLRAIVNTLDDYDQRIVVEAMRSCSFRSTEVHEVLSRARGGSIVADDNVLALCHFCHAWVTIHPRLATIAGLLIPSWRR